MGGPFRELSPGNIETTDDGGQRTDRSIRKSGRPSSAVMTSATTTTPRRRSLSARPRRSLRRGSSERSSATSTRRLTKSKAADWRSRGRGRSTSISSKMRPGRGHSTMIRSASTIDSSTSWVTRIKVGLASAHRSSRWSCRSARVNASSAENGSSSSSTSGRGTSARAMATRCAWPPESSRGHIVALSVSPTRLSAVATRAARSALGRPPSPKPTLSATLSQGSSRGSWKMMPIFSCGAVMRSPSSTTAPSLGGSSPPMARSNVDLPEPEPPITATISPSSTSSVTPPSACTPLG